MKVRGYRLVVRPDPVESRTKSGIYIQHDEQKVKLNQMYGVVVDVGDECWPDQEPWCVPGDRIAWSKYAGKFIINEDNEQEELVILNDEDVLCTFERKENNE